MWTTEAMARRIDWERRRLDRRPRVSAKDEDELRQHDTAARWLERAEAWEQAQRKPTGKRKKKKKRRPAKRGR